MNSTAKRSIVHMDLDTFFVSCERLIDSRLNGKPVLIGGTSDRGVVASCSYEARKYGVHSAMPMRMAKQLCPEAIVLRGNSGIYTKYSKMVTEVIHEMVPLYEKASIDEFYIDLTGMDQFFGNHQLAPEWISSLATTSWHPNCESESYRKPDYPYRLGCL
jgi:DNA polymerase-4